jgi:hypothetical protein
MVTLIEMISQRYAMGSSDPFPVRFKIWFASLNFQATGNDYLMCLTNRDELHPWRSTKPGPIPARRPGTGTDDGGNRLDVPTP